MILCMMIERYNEFCMMNQRTRDRKSCYLLQVTILVLAWRDLEHLEICIRIIRFEPSISRQQSRNVTVCVAWVGSD
jgi:hypothetical protein